MSQGHSSYIAGKPVMGCEKHMLFWTGQVSTHAQPCRHRSQNTFVAKAASAHSAGRGTALLRVPAAGCRPSGSASSWAACSAAGPAACGRGAEPGVAVHSRLLCCRCRCCLLAALSALHQVPLHDFLDDLRWDGGKRRGENWREERQRAGCTGPHSSTPCCTSAAAPRRSTKGGGTACRPTQPARPLGEGRQQRSAPAPAAGPLCAAPAWLHPCPRI